MNKLLAFSMPVWAIVLIVVGGLIALFLVWLWASYNKLITLKNDVEEGFSTIEVYLKKRYSLIPNLVSTVKGVTKQEKEVFEAVVNARRDAMGATTVAEKSKQEGILSNSLKSLFALSESYPELKSNENFLKLQEDLSKIESEVTEARKYYNAVAKRFNVSIQTFPNVLIAKRFHCFKQDLFEIENEMERNDVKVEF